MRPAALPGKEEEAAEGDKEERERKENKKERKKNEKIEKEGYYGHFTFFMYFKQFGGAVLPNGFQNDSSSIREAAPPEEPEPFLEESELCQTDPLYNMATIETTSGFLGWDWPKVAYCTYTCIAVLFCY